MRRSSKSILGIGLVLVLSLAISFLVAIVAWVGYSGSSQAFHSNQPTQTKGQEITQEVQDQANNGQVETIRSSPDNRGGDVKTVQQQEPLQVSGDKPKPEHKDPADDAVYIDAVQGVVAEARAHALAGMRQVKEEVDVVVEAFGDGTGQRRRLARIRGEQYPYLRIVEQWHEDAAGQRVITQRHEEVADHILLRFHDHMDHHHVQAFAEEWGFSLRQRLGSSQRYLLSFPLEHPDSILAYVDLVKDLPQVAVVDKDHIYYTLGTPPNDEFFPLQWGLHNTGQEIQDGVTGTAGADIRAVDAWQIHTGSRQVAVAVIDSGVDFTHPDLAANIWQNPGERISGSDDNGSGFIDDIRGWHFVRNNNNVRAIGSSHGTHVAGIIGAIGNNHTGVAGVAWNVSLVPLSVRGYLGIRAATAIEAIDYSVARGIPISNNSWGGNQYNQLMYESIQQAEQTGQLFIAAAGNSDADDERNIDDRPVYPAAYDLPNIIAVAATDYHDQRPLFSNFGPNTVHIAAPGKAIYSTVNQGDGIGGGDYDWWDGTSMAAPYVSGVAALLLSINPDLSYQELMDLIFDHADQISSLENSVQSGRRLNAHAALAALAAEETVVVRKDSWTLEDGSSHGADGNGDGIINPGERVALHVQISNTGSVAAEDLGVSAAISNGAEFIAIHAGEHINIGSLSDGSSLQIGPLVLDIDDATPAATLATLRLTFEMDNGRSQQHYIPLGIYNSYPIEGYVTFAVDASPIAEQEVTVYGRRNKSVTLVTDADGYYHYVATDGPYTVKVQRDGYPLKTRGVHIPGLDDRVDFALGQPSIEVDTTPIHVHVAQGGIAQFSVSVENHGDVGLRWIAAGSERDYQVMRDDESPDFAYAWQDISEDGGVIPNMVLNTVSPWLSLPFPFPYYDQSHQQLVVCSSGFTAFDDGFIQEWQDFDRPVGHFPKDLPTGDTPSDWSEMGARAKIAFLWRSLDFDAGSDRTEAYFKEDQDRFIVQFSEVLPEWYENENEAATVQLVLHADGVIDKHYHTLEVPEFGISTTIGIQDHQRERGITLEDPEPVSGESLRYVPVDRFSMPATPTPVAPAASGSGTVQLAAGDWQPGEYQKTLLIHHNDPDNPSIEIPIIITVYQADRTITMRGLAGGDQPHPTLIKVWQEGELVHEDDHEGREEHEIHDLRRDQDTVLRLYEFFEIDQVSTDG